jgi:hypothetical protein
MLNRLPVQNYFHSAHLPLLKENSDQSSPLLVVNFPQMNFSQMHERLRLELMRRIERGTLSVSLLARQTGFGQSHLSNFLHNRRQLSLDAMDRILTAQQLAAADLMPARSTGEPFPLEEDVSSIPVVSHGAALFEPVIRSTVAQTLLHLPSHVLESVRPRSTIARRAWQRFVAVRAPAADAFAMHPLILPEAVAILDRHYTSLAPYRPERPNLYAVRNGSHLTLRYADFLSNRLVLRPHNIASPVDLLETEPGGSPSDLIIGRVVLVLNET